MNRNVNALAGPSDTPLYMLSGDQLSLEVAYATTDSVDEVKSGMISYEEF